MTTALIGDLLSNLVPGTGTIAGVPAKDTIKRVNAESIVQETLVRSELWNIQTPQCFYTSEILSCYAHALEDGYTGTDDASLAEKYGYAPEKFTQAVTDAGMTGSAIVLLVNREDPLRLRAAQSIAEMLTACGLTVTIPEVTGEDYLNYLKWGEFDLFLGQTKLSPNMDLTAFFAEKGALNYGNLTDVAANAMSLEALADSGNYQSLHKLVMDDGRLCPILVRSDAVYGRRGLFPELSTARDHVFYYSLGKTMEDAKITE